VSDFLVARELLLRLKYQKKLCLSITCAEKICSNDVVSS
jgi:hypothetical protein